MHEYQPYSVWSAILAGVPLGIHRTYLASDGSKARVEPPKASLGPIWGGAIRLDTFAPELPLVVGEGIESSASAARLLGFPGWAAISAGNLGRGLLLPPDVRRVIIAADPDDAGRAAAEKLGCGGGPTVGKCRSRCPIERAPTSTTCCLRARRRMPNGGGFSLGKAPAGSLQVLTAHELLAMQLPPRETVLWPWLPSQGLAMLYGPRGIGKTHVSLGAAYAIASGGRFLRWHARTPRRVLLIDGEMPAYVLQQRLAAIAAASPIEPPSPDYLRILAIDLQSRSLDLTNDKDQRDLALEMGDAEVTIIDNISSLARAGRETKLRAGCPCKSGHWSNAAPGVR